MSFDSTLPVFKVYFIQSVTTGYIKIGRTIGNKDRLKTLQIGNHDELRLLGTTLQFSEHALHKAFAPLRIRGEWFRPHPILRMFIGVSKKYLKDADCDALLAQVTRYVRKNPLTKCERCELHPVSCRIKSDALDMLICNNCRLEVMTTHHRAKIGKIQFIPIIRMVGKRQKPKRKYQHSRISK